MPRPNTPAAADPQPETGLAALEARVEEMQTEAAIEAELSVEDAAAAAAAIPLEQVSPPAAEPGAWTGPLDTGAAQAATADAAGAAASVFGALQDVGQATLRFQTETFASFTSVRSPQDLLAAQAAYGQRIMGLYAQNLARLTQALPTLASFAPR